MNRSFLRILCKIALVYVMENHITSKCGFFAFGYDMVTKYVEKKSHTRESREIDLLTSWIWLFFIC